MRPESDAVASKARILLVDDHPIVLQGLKQLINEEDALTVCGEASDSSETLEAVESLKPDLAIVDLSLKGGSGLDLIKTLRARHPEILVLVLSMHEESLYAERALRAGARGYVMKEEATECLIAAIRKVLKGLIYVSDKLANRLLTRIVEGGSQDRDSIVDKLSDRELQVFEMIGRGFSTRQVAERLKLSIKTIETYREHIKEKLGLHHATELVQYAVNWVQQPRA
jgi:DNA-binding NarL/FixJ family response regulator